MRYVVERDLARMQYKVYYLHEEGDKRYASTPSDGGGYEMVELHPGAEVPVFMTLPMDLADAIVGEHLGRERPALETERVLLTQHREDAIGVRDRLLAMLEHVEARTTRNGV